MVKKEWNKRLFWRGTFFAQTSNKSGVTSRETGSTHSRTLYRILTITTRLITVVSIMTNVTFCEEKRRHKLKTKYHIAIYQSNTNQYDVNTELLNDKGSSLIVIFYIMKLTYLDYFFFKQVHLSVLFWVFITVCGMKCTRYM